VTTFSPHLNVGYFIQVQNIGVTFSNKFEKGDWSFILRVRANIVIEHIDPFMFNLFFVVIHSIHSFIQRQNLQELRTIELMVTKICGSLQRVSF
jgi:hypothetical protein